MTCHMNQVNFQKLPQGENENQGLVFAEAATGGVL